MWKRGALRTVAEHLSSSANMPDDSVRIALIIDLALASYLPGLVDGDRLRADSADDAQIDHSCLLRPKDGVARGTASGSIDAGRIAGADDLPAGADRPARAPPTSA